jgi:hypothetical protein
MNNGLSNLNVISLAASGNNLFAGTNNGGIYLSLNNGGSWNAVNTGLPVNATPYSLAMSGTAVFAGLKNNGVYVSNTNGSNWSAANTGLPNPNTTILALSGSYVIVGIDLSGLWKRPVSEMISAVEGPDDTYQFSVHPNPFSFQTVIESSYPLKDACLKVYNLQGKLVRQSDHVSGMRIQLDRDQLPQGLYIVQLTEANSYFSTQKLLISDQ